LPAEYDLASLINDTMQLHLMRIGSKLIEFELHVDENTPAVVVGDVLRVKQVLNNILSNAFKYTAKGMVTLSVSHEAGGGDSHPQGELSTRESGQEETDVTLVFRVSDTGQGMKAEQVATLFDEYTRFNQETNRTIAGTGLGMNITRNLVRQMNGEILVESAPGKGSTFTVRLPQRKVGAEVLGRELVDALRQFRLIDTAYMQRAQIVREPMPYGSVLVVDDVATNIYVARGLLASYGLKIDSAESGFEALEKVEQGQVYDIVFMDHMMPGMDGMETTYVLRTRGYTQPIVALTANAMQGQAEVFRESGFDDFIAKPIDMRQMNAILNKYVRDRHPPEVVEAARRQKNDTDGRTAAPRPQTLADPKLAKIFIRDASTSLAVLEALREKQDASYSDEDIRAYIVNTHGIKSALANIGELELSALASKLEQAGRDRDSTLMASETPAFLDALRKLIVNITPKEADESSDITDEDRVYLREKLLELKAACVAYNKKVARDTLTEIEQKAWPRPTGEMLDAIGEQLLHSKFKAIVSIVDEAVLAL
jgi:CheY-like chemotaxis protein/two-component sensor histidine kinase